MNEVRLVAPRVLVIRDGEEPLEVQTDNRDLLAWEKTRVRHKWPKFDEAPFQWLTFLAWSAARRSGQLENGLTYEKWEGSVLSVRDTASMEDNDELGTPTESAPATD